MANKYFSASEWEWVWARIFYMQQCVILYYTYMYIGIIFLTLFVWFEFLWFYFEWISYRCCCLASWFSIFQLKLCSYYKYIFHFIFFLFFFLLVLLNYILFYYSAHVHESDHSIAYYFDIKLTKEGKDKVQCFSTLSKLTSNI